MKLAERVFRCDACGLIMDRDRNAAANLAAWAERARAWTAKRAARSPMPLEGKALAVGLTAAKPAPWKEEPKLQRWLEPRTPEKGGVQAPTHAMPDALEPMPLPLNST